LVLAGAEPQRQGEVVLGRADLGGFHQVARDRVGVGGGQGVVVVELGEPVAVAAGETAGDLGEWRGGVERGEDRLGGVAVGGVGGGEGGGVVAARRPPLRAPPPPLPFTLGSKRRYSLRSLWPSGSKLVRSSRALRPGSVT